MTLTQSERAEYNVRLAKHAQQKAQFMALPIVKAQRCGVWVDYGCADGQVTKFISYECDEAIGYDRHASEKWPQYGLSNLQFAYTFDRLMEKLNSLSPATRNDGVGVFLGSILHEIYSEHLDYALWDRVNELQPKIVVIRDMCLWPEPPLQIREMLADKIRETAQEMYPEHWRSFTMKWGWSWKHCVHWLLKYRYRGNWEYEMLEDYMVVTPKMLVDTMASHGYYPLHLEAKRVSFIEEQWVRDFGLDIEHPTHVVAVFKNRRFA